MTSSAGGLRINMPRKRLRRKEDVLLNCVAEGINGFATVTRRFQPRFCLPSPARFQYVEAYLKLERNGDRQTG